MIFKMRTHFLIYKLRVTAVRGRGLQGAVFKILPFAVGIINRGSYKSYKTK